MKRKRIDSDGRPSKRTKVMMPSERPCEMSETLPTDKEAIRITSGERTFFCECDLKKEEKNDEELEERLGRCTFKALEDFIPPQKGERKSKVKILKKQLKTLATSDLLLDKYRPKSFLDLLTSEAINRRVLSWVKEWDPVTFPQKRRNSGKRRGPYRRILILAGPPGIGKTTLAHIIAQSAGYEPVEINASDDRSKKRLVELINNISQKKNVFFSKKTRSRELPKLLILDEIDGVQGGKERSAVDSLVRATNPAKFAESSNKFGFGAFGGQKKKKKKPKRKRNKGEIDDIRIPVICICNDLYSPVLRDLRRNAEVIIFGKNLPGKRIVDRLMYICKTEKLKIPRGVITKLVDFYQNDIRSCLNYLQFNASKLIEIGSNFGSGIDTAALFADALKDVKKDKRDILDFIFIKPKHNYSVLDMHNYLSTEIGNESLLSGVFQNYTQAKYLDLNMIKTVGMLDFLTFAEECNGKVLETQVYGLRVYMIFALIYFKIQCASSYNFGRLDLRSSDWEFRRVLQNRKNVLKSFKEGLDGVAYSTMGYNERLILDYFPILERIYHPVTLTKRQLTNLSLLTPKEKQTMRRIIQIHNGLGTTYLRQKDFQQKRQEFVLHPNILSLTGQFRRKSEIGMEKGLSYHLKKFISRQTGEYREKKKRRREREERERREDEKRRKEGSEDVEMKMKKKKKWKKKRPPPLFLGKGKKETRKDNNMYMKRIQKQYKQKEAEVATPHPFPTPTENKNKMVDDEADLFFATDENAPPVIRCRFVYEEGSTTAVRTKISIDDF